MDHEHELHVHFHTEGLTITVNHVVSVDCELYDLIHSIKKDIAHMVTTVQEAVDDLTAKVARLTTVDESAVALIKGFPALIAAAVAAAQAAGATPAQLQAFTDLSQKITEDTDVLAGAVTEGTPAA